MNDLVNPASRWGVLSRLRLDGALTIDALVAAIRLSKTAVRAQLVRLETEGAVERAATEAAGPGRPPAAFQLTEAGAAMFPSDSGLLGQLMGFLEVNGAGALVQRFFEQMWAERQRDLLWSLGADTSTARPLEARLEAIEALLARTGFMPVIERRTEPDGTEVVTIRECNCPYFAAAKASKTPCRLEVAFLARALGAQPRTAAFAKMRKDSCMFEFVVAASAAR